MKAAGIYEIRNTVTGKAYIGSSLVCERRWGLHKSQLKAGKHHSSKLQGSWNKHGEQAFEFLVLEVVADPSDLLAREQFWMDERQCYHHGYNSRPDARSNIGIKHRPESIEKLRASKMGQKQSREVIDGISAKNRGQKRTEEQRKAISLRGMGRVASQETLAKQRAAMIKAWESGAFNRAGTFGGRSHTEETKKLISEAKRGKRPRSHEKQKLDMEKARAIRAMREEGYTFAQIGERFGVTGTNARFVCIGKIWREGAPQLPESARRRLKRAA